MVVQIELVVGDGLAKNYQLAGYNQVRDLGFAAVILSDGEDYGRSTPRNTEVREKSRFLFWVWQVRDTYDTSGWKCQWNTSLKLGSRGSGFPQGSSSFINRQ